MSLENVSFRIDKLINKLPPSDAKIYYETSEGRHRAETLAEFANRIINSGTSGIIKQVDLTKSREAIGNGVLYMIACLCDGYYETDEKGNAIIKTE